MIAAAVARCRSRVSALAATALAQGRGERDLLGLLEGVWSAIDEELARRTDGAPPPACGPGCASCCRINVGTLAVEGAAAAVHLRGVVRDPAATAAALHAFHERVRWLEDRQRVAERLACPLLDPQGRCAVHPVRPLACRSVTSIDAADCRRALAADRDDDGEDAQLVRMDLLQRALHDEARVALAEALGALGLDARSRDVSGMIAAFLGDPGLAAAYLAGARVPLP